MMAYMQRPRLGSACTPHSHQLMVGLLVNMVAPLVRSFLFASRQTVVVVHACFVSGIREKLTNYHRLPTYAPYREQANLIE